MTVLRILSLILYWSIAYGKVSWQLTSRRIEIGESIVLTCTVDGVKTIDPHVNRQWSIGEDDTLIAINGLINKQEKYKEILSTGNQFSLQINNVTEADLESIYECGYDFDVNKKRLEVDKSKIIYPPTGDTMNITFSHSGSTATININFMMIVPLPNCTIEYQNKTLAEFVLVTFNRNKSFAEASVNVTLSCKDETSVCNKKYRIVCDIGSSKYYMTRRDFVNTDYCETITMALSITCGILFLGLVFCAIHIFRKRKKEHTNQKDISLHGSDVQESSSLMEYTA